MILKKGNKNQALIAASGMLLFNFSDVFKDILINLAKLEGAFIKKVLPILDLTFKNPNKIQTQPFS